MLQHVRLTAIMYISVRPAFPPDIRIIWLLYRVGWMKVESNCIPGAIRKLIEWKANTIAVSVTLLLEYITMILLHISAYIVRTMERRSMYWLIKINIY